MDGVCVSRGPIQFLGTLEAATSIPAEKAKSNALWSICRQSLDGELSCKELREVAFWTLGFVDQIPSLRIRSYALSHIFEALKSAQDEANALGVFKKNEALVNAMTYPVDQFKATFIIAQTLAKTGELTKSLEYFGKALARANVVSKQWDRDYAFYVITKELVQMGKFFVAKKFISEIVDQPLKEKVLSQIRKSEKENLVPSL